MYHAEFVDFRSTLAVLLPLSQMFKDVKAAWPMPWLARGYHDGLIHTVVNINTNIMMLFCSSSRRLCLTQASHRRRRAGTPR